VPADFWSVPADWSWRRVLLARIDPGTVFAGELRHLHVLVFLAVAAESSGGGDGAFIVCFTPAGRARDRAAEPRRRFRPAAGIGRVEVGPLFPAETMLEVGKILADIRGVARPHERLRRGRGRAGENRTAAGVEIEIGTAGTIHDFPSRPPNRIAASPN